MLRVRELAAVLLLVLSCWAAGVAAQGQAAYDLLVLRQDWPPSSCGKATANCTRQTFGAFGVYELVPTNIAESDPYQQGPCPGAPFDVSQIPQDVRDELSCVFYSGEGNDTLLWENLWNVQGRCSGLSIKEFFEAVIGAFHTYNANNPVRLAGITLDIRPWVDRDVLLNSLQAIWGKKAWLACDPSTRDLLYVSTCFLPIAPSDPWNLTLVDCPWDRNSPDSPGGAECAGLLRMRPGAPPSPRCEKFYPVTIRGAFPDPSLLLPAPAPQAAVTAPPSASVPAQQPAQPPGLLPPVAAGPLPGPSPLPSPASTPSPVPSSSPPAQALSPVVAPVAPYEQPEAMGSAAASSSGSKTVVVVGSVIGALLAVVAAGALFFSCRKRAAVPPQQQPLCPPDEGSDSLEKGDMAGLGTLAALPGKLARTDSQLSPSEPSSFALLATRAPIDEGAAAWLAGGYTSPRGGSPRICATTGASVEVQPLATDSPHATLSPQRLPSLEPLEDDPLLSQIATVLTSVRQQQEQQPGLGPQQQGRAPQQQQQQQQAPPRQAALERVATEGATSAGSSDSGGPLSWEVAHWTVRWEQLKVQRLIGRGSFGKVYLAYWNATPVAVKLLIRADGISSLESLELPESVMRQLQEEAAVMTRIRHINVVSFMGLVTLPPCIITEYCSRGSLFDVLRRASREPACAAELTWQRRIHMAFGAARGLLYLHCRGILHHDIKSANLLVDEDWHVKVCDFNLSEILKRQDSGGTTARENATNPMWLAPEVLLGRPATAAADVYAFGLVLWELLAWRLPWDTRSPYQVRSFVLAGGRPELPVPEALPGPAPPPPQALAAYCSLMRDCWSPEPGERPTFADIVARLSTLLEFR